MIRALHLHDFGKFADVSFPFGEVTVFYGANEAGKTTIHDALFDGLCAPSGNTSPARKLNARYGRTRRASIEFDGDRLSLDVGAFDNLHEVASGDLTVEFDDGSAWMDRVKAALFSGGIDPVPLRDNLEKMGSHGGTYRHNRKLHQIQNELEHAEVSLKELRDRRAEILRGERRKGPLKDSLERDTEAREKLVLETKTLEAALDEEEAIAKRRALDDVLKELAERDRCLSRLDEYEVLEGEETEDLDRLQSAADRLRKEEQAGSIKQDQLREQIEAVQERLAVSKQAAVEAGKTAEIASELRERISVHRADQPLVKTVRWRSSWLVSASVGAAGGLGFFVQTESVYALLFGLIWLALFGVLARKTTLSVSQAESEEFLRDLLRRWEQGGGESTSAFSLAAVESLLVDAEGGSRSLSDQVGHDEEDLAKLQKQIGLANHKAECYLDDDEGLGKLRLLRAHC